MSEIRKLRWPEDRGPLLALWRGIGWLDDIDDDEPALGWYLQDAVGLGADLHGELAGIALRQPGDLCYDGQLLPSSLVSAVSVARHARSEGMGSRLTATLVADAAAEGAAVSILGAYDTGYYDRLGFGLAANAREITLDPADLRVPRLTRSPVLLTVERDGERMLRNRQRRMRVHGSASYDSLGLAVGEACWVEHSYGMGFEGPDGELTHHLFLEREGEHGPDKVLWMAYSTFEQAIELLSVIASWASQVHGVRLVEPPGLHLQELMREPFRRFRTSRGSPFEQRPEAHAWQQLRVLDLPACMAAVRLSGEPVAFELELDDPIEGFVDRERAWQGLGGVWTVELGPTSTARRGGTEGLARMRAGVSAFTRLWYGSAAASSLRGMGRLEAPDALVEQLDRRWRLPVPHVDWDA